VQLGAAVLGVARRRWWRKQRGRSCSGAAGKKKGERLLLLLFASARASGEHGCCWASVPMMGRVARIDTNAEVEGQAWARGCSPSWR